MTQLNIYPFADPLANLFVDTGTPVFIPKKHTIKTYGQQRREAKKRKRAKQ